MPNKSTEDKLVKFIRANKWAQFVTIKDDASIHPDNNDCCCNDEDCSTCGDTKEYGREIVISTKYGDWTIITAICNELNAHKVLVNKTCGLHVHFDCRHLTSRQVSARGKRIANCVPALKQMLPKSRQNNTFCRETINKMRGNSRYSFVNLASYSKYKTLEVRGHSGTTDGIKIVNWIRIIHNIMNHKTIIADNINTMTDLIKFDADLEAYIVNRAIKFNPQTQLPLIDPILCYQNNTIEPIDDIAEDNESANAA